MAQFYVYKTKKGEIITVTLAHTQDETRVHVYEGFPHSPVKFLNTFEADAQCDYIHNMVNLLTKYLPVDKALAKLVKRIRKEGI